MTIEEKLNRYNELKRWLTIHRKSNPMSCRIEPNGKLENKIKEVFSAKRATEILSRPNCYEYSDWKEWDNKREEFIALRDELEEIGVIE